jgi:hypothetical protein
MTFYTTNEEISTGVTSTLVNVMRYNTMERNESTKAKYKRRNDRGIRQKGNKIGKKEIREEYINT